ncbi:hypothetical protein [Streptomyces collinus]
MEREGADRPVPRGHADEVTVGAQPVEGRVSRSVGRSGDVRERPGGLN